MSLISKQCPDSLETDQSSNPSKTDQSSNPLKTDQQAPSVITMANQRRTGNVNSDLKENAETAAQNQEVDSDNVVISQPRECDLNALENQYSEMLTVSAQLRLRASIASRRYFYVDLTRW